MPDQTTFGDQPTRVNAAELLKNVQLREKQTFTPGRWPYKYALDFTRQNRHLVPDEAVSIVWNYYMERGDPDSAPHRAGKGGGIWSRGVTSHIIEEWANLIGQTDLFEQLALAMMTFEDIRFPEHDEEKYDDVRRAISRDTHLPGVILSLDSIEESQARE